MSFGKSKQANGTIKITLLEVEILNLNILRIWILHCGRDFNQLPNKKNAVK